MRLIEVFSNPRKIVKDSFLKPSLPMAVFLIALNVIVSTVALFFSTGFFSINSFLSILALNFLSVIVFCLLIAILGFFFRGKTVFKRIKGIFTSLSLASIFSIFFAALSALFLLLSFPTLPAQAKKLFSGEAGIEQISTSLSEQATPFLAFSLPFLAVIAIVSLFYSFYIFFLAIYNAAETTILKTFFLAIIIAIIHFLLFLALFALFFPLQ